MFSVVKRERVRNTDSQSNRQSRTNQLFDINTRQSTDLRTDRIALATTSGDRRCNTKVTEQIIRGKRKGDRPRTEFVIGYAKAPRRKRWSCIGTQKGAGVRAGWSGGSALVPPPKVPYGSRSSCNVVRTPEGRRATKLRRMMDSSQPGLRGNEQRLRNLEKLLHEDPSLGNPGTLTSPSSFYSFPCIEVGGGRRRTLTRSVPQRRGGPTHVFRNIQQNGKNNEPVSPRETKERKPALQQILYSRFEWVAIHRPIPYRIHTSPKRIGGRDNSNIERQRERGPLEFEFQRRTMHIMWCEVDCGYILKHDDEQPDCKRTGVEPVKNV